MLGFCLCGTWIRESTPQKSLNSGLRIIAICPDLDGTHFTGECATVGFNQTNCLTGDCGRVGGLLTQ